MSKGYEDLTAEGAKVADLAAKRAENNGQGEGDPLLEKFRALLLTAEQLIDRPPPEPLIGGTEDEYDVLIRNSLAMLYGESGAGKSFLALDWALCVATGMPWQARPVHRASVLYVVGEGDAGFGMRVAAWQARYGPVDLGDIRFLPLAPNLLDTRPGGEASALTKLAELLGAELVVIDTLARATVGGDENSARDMGLAVDAANQLRQATEATVLIVHHTGKDGETYRGSSALKAAMDTQIKVNGNGDAVIIKCEKQKDTAEFKDIRVKLDVVALPSGRTSCVLQSLDRDALAERDVSNQERVLRAMRETFSATGAKNDELIDVLSVGHDGGMATSSFYHARNALMKAGFLVKRGHLLHLGEGEE